MLIILLFSILSVCPVHRIVHRLLSGGLDYNDRIDGRAAVTPSGDDDMRYLWTDDALPVTPAFLKNQLKYEKQRAQVLILL